MSMNFTIVSSDALNHDPGKLGAIDEQGNLRIMPAAFYRQFSQESISAFCVVNGLYCLPTLELVAWLQGMLGESRTIEIGSGNGILARALGFQATDNWMQTWPEIAQTYQRARQATVKYAPWVENIDAHQAIAKYMPDVVLACWVTHKYREDRHERGGNMWGVDEEQVLGTCKTYVHVGNTKTHEAKFIRNMPHRRYKFDWLVSRALQPHHNEIWVWGKHLPGESPET